MNQPFPNNFTHTSHDSNYLANFRMLRSYNFTRLMVIKIFRMHLQHKILFFIGLLGGMSIMAQTTTNWPYSVYGIGDIQPNGFPQSKAMGGAGIAVPCETSLNNLNPACYQGIDKYTVLLEGGINSRLSQFRDGIWTQNNTNINFNYLAIGFRTTDWWVLSLGL